MKLLSLFDRVRSKFHISPYSLAIREIGSLHHFPIISGASSLDAWWEIHRFVPKECAHSNRDFQAKIHIINRLHSLHNHLKLDGWNEEGKYNQIIPISSENMHREYTLQAWSAQHDIGVVNRPHESTRPYFNPCLLLADTLYLRCYCALNSF